MLQHLHDNIFLRGPAEFISTNIDDEEDVLPHTISLSESADEGDDDNIDDEEDQTGPPHKSLFLVESADEAAMDPTKTKYGEPFYLTIGVMQIGQREDVCHGILETYRCLCIRDDSCKNGLNAFLFYF